MVPIATPDRSPEMREHDEADHHDPEDDRQRATAGTLAFLLSRSRGGGVIVADGAARLPTIAGYRMPGVAATTQLIRFDLAGISVSAGSACSSGSLKPSHVLAAMGWEEDAAREVIRVSFGPDTDAADIDRFVAEWRSIRATASVRRPETQEKERAA